MPLFSKFKQWQFSKVRLETFSDAVFAIVITLLVLDIKIPHIQHPEDIADVVASLKSVSHVFFSWAISFFFVALIWLHHHQIMHMSVKSDYGVVWINNILLFFVTLLPFPTSLMGEYPHQAIMVAFWGVTVGLITLILTWFYHYNTSNYLRQDSFDKESVSKNVRLTLFAGPLLYMAAAALSFINVNIAYGIYVFVPVLYVLPIDKEYLPGSRKKESDND